MNLRRRITFLVLVAAAGAVLFWLTRPDTAPPPAAQNSANADFPAAADSPSLVRNDVPFTAQAPFANWGDPRYQNGCEEASILMAWRWIESRPLTAAEANEIIADMVLFEQQRYGVYLDTSAEDTARVFRDFYHHDGVKTSRDVSVQSIKKELAEKKLIIVPMDGRKLGNPNYTQPGPERHMLVITGFNEAKGVFITNDPGTRKGHNYPYSYDTLFGAIRDYESGDHEPITQERKVMIIVAKTPE